MFQKMLRTKLAPKAGSKKGFTLAELLIVVAIIAVLVAIAVPIFAAQLDKAYDRTVTSNMRSAISMASSEFLVTLDPLNPPTADTTYQFNISDNSELVMLTGTATGDYAVTLDTSGNIKTLKHPAFKTGTANNTTTLEPTEPTP